MKKTKAGDSFYEAVVETETFAEDAYSGTFVATRHTASPWNREHQHAGPPCALLVRAIERLSIPTPRPLTNQISVDILAPIPLGAIAVTAEVVREGHFASLVEAELTHAGYSDPIMRVSAWRTRRTTLADASPEGDVPTVPDKGPKAKPPAAWSKGFGQAMRWRSEVGTVGDRSRATVWARPRVGLVDAEPVAGIPLLALMGAATSTLSPLTDPEQSVIVSTDLSLHAVREPVGEAMWITTESFLDREGVGVATATIGDKQGSLAVANQSLFLVERAEVRF